MAIQVCYSENKGECWWILKFKETVHYPLPDSEIISGTRVYCEWSCGIMDLLWSEFIPDLACSWQVEAGKLVGEKRKNFLF